MRRCWRWGVLRCDDEAMTHLEKLRGLLEHPEDEQSEQGCELALSLGLQDELVASLEWDGGTPLLPNRHWLRLLLASEARREVLGLPWLRLSAERLAEVLKGCRNLVEVNLLGADEEHIAQLLRRSWRRLGLRCSWRREEVLQPLGALKQVQELDLTAPVLPHLRWARPTRLRFAGRTTDGQLPTSITVLENLARDLVPRHMAGLVLDVLEVHQAGHWSLLPRSRLLRAATATTDIAAATTEELHVLHSFTGDPAVLPQLTWVAVRGETVPWSAALRVLDLPADLEPLRPAGTRPSPLGTGLFVEPPQDWLSEARQAGPWRVRVVDPEWRKIATIKEFRHLTGLGLLAAKRHADPLRVLGCLGLDRRRAEELAVAIDETGGRAVVERY